MLLLLEHYKKYMETKKIVVTENILKWTNQYKEETDIYLNFFTECTEEADTHISKSSIYEAFKTWFVMNNPKTHIPSNREFSTNIKKHKVIKKVRVGGSVVHGIEKLKLLEEYE
jgi:phage/plasmid-associated DNA primase